MFPLIMNIVVLLYFEMVLVVSNPTVSNKNNISETNLS